MAPKNLKEMQQELETLPQLQAVVNHFSGSDPLSAVSGALGLANGVSPLSAVIQTAENSGLLGTVQAQLTDAVPVEQLAEMGKNVTEFTTTMARDLSGINRNDPESMVKAVRTAAAGARQLNQAALTAAETVAAKVEEVDGAIAKADAQLEARMPALLIRLDLELQDGVDQLTENVQGIIVSEVNRALPDDLKGILPEEMVQEIVRGVAENAASTSQTEITGVLDSVRQRIREKSAEAVSMSRQAVEKLQQTEQHISTYEKAMVDTTAYLHEFEKTMPDTVVTAIKRLDEHKEIMEEQLKALDKLYLQQSETEYKLASANENDKPKLEKKLADLQERMAKAETKLQAAHHARQGIRQSVETAFKDVPIVKQALASAGGDAARVTSSTREDFKATRDPKKPKPLSQLMRNSVTESVLGDKKLGLRAVMYLSEGESATTPQKASDKAAAATKPVTERASKMLSEALWTIVKNPRTLFRGAKMLGAVQDPSAINKRNYADEVILKSVREQAISSIPKGPGFFYALRKKDPLAMMERRLEANKYAGQATAMVEMISSSDKLSVEDKAVLFKSITEDNKAMEKIRDVEKDLRQIEKKIAAQEKAIAELERYEQQEPGKQTKNIAAAKEKLAKLVEKRQALHAKKSGIEQTMAKRHDGEVFRKLDEVIAEAELGRELTPEEKIQIHGKIADQARDVLASTDEQLEAVDGMALDEHATKKLDELGGQANALACDAISAGLSTLENADQLIQMGLETALEQGIAAGRDQAVELARQMGGPAGEQYANMAVDAAAAEMRAVLDAAQPDIREVAAMANEQAAQAIDEAAKRGVEISRDGVAVKGEVTGQVRGAAATAGGLAQQALGEQSGKVREMLTTASRTLLRDPTPSLANRGLEIAAKSIALQKRQEMAQELEQRRSAIHAPKFSPTTK